VFPTPLYYNRLTGGFTELPGGECCAEVAEQLCSSSLQGASSLMPPVDAADEERERMVFWAKTQRLPMFFRQ